MDTKPYLKEQLHELLYQALEAERGGIKIYETALLCVQKEDLKWEWENCLEQTRAHERLLLNVFRELGLNPEAETPGREVAAYIGDSLVIAMKMARARGSSETAQLVAGECVVLGETRDHQNWEVIGHLAEHGQGAEISAVRAAFERVGQEDEHQLYQTKGFVRELWIESLGLCRRTMQVWHGQRM